MGLRQEFPMHTNKTLVRLECPTPESVFFSFSTIRTWRCRPFDSFPLPQDRGNVRAPWCRLSTLDETSLPKCCPAAPAQVSQRTLRDPSTFARPPQYWPRTRNP